MPAATAERKAAKPAVENKMVLVIYDPEAGLSETGDWSTASINIPIKNKTGYSALTLKPGIQEIPLSEWQVWESCQSASIGRAVRTGVLAKVSDVTDVMEMDSLSALRVIQKTNDPALLERWAERFQEMTEEMRAAMFAKQDAMKEELRRDRRPVQRVLFGKIVA